MAMNADKAVRRVSVLGSTGSVGRNTLDLLLRDPGHFEVESLTANRNVELLAHQARQTRAKCAVVADPAAYKRLQHALSGSGTEVAAGPDAIAEAGARSAEWVMAAIVGFAGLPPILKAAARGATIALANKEALVCAGSLLMDAVKRGGATLLPVDSEHNAIFQCLEERNRDQVERLVLTASGGPFRTWSTEAMATATPPQALKHPNWDMGAKISIDSATMMNKGLELIEAYHLFGLPGERIEIVVHPQSVIHSMVAYTDGSVLAQLGTPDMRTPIAHALAWPGRMPGPSPRLDFRTLGALTFEPPDERRFPALKLARQALVDVSFYPVIMNASNEIAVESYLKYKISFPEIAQIVENVLELIGMRRKFNDNTRDIEFVVDLDTEARREARRLCESRAINH